MVSFPMLGWFYFVFYH